MEKILLLALENYGSTFVEPKVELGARFGHLVCEYRLPTTTNLHLGFVLRMNSDLVLFPRSRFSVIPYANIKNNMLHFIRRFGGGGDS